jgi:hypothetical protein
MKLVIKISAFILVTGLVIFFSCKKAASCEGCNESNKPPIAIAGPDQIITLPTDSVSLDEISSRDPDGRISEWIWTKFLVLHLLISLNPKVGNKIVFALSGLFNTPTSPM